MISIEINSLKVFTDLLFNQNTFDKFNLYHAEFVTSYEVTESGITPWQEFRDIAFRLLKGNELPKSFQVILLTSEESTKAMVTKTNFTGCEVTSMSMNISYHEEKLFLTTGIAYNGFSLDKSLEKYWDDSVKNFLNSKNCEYTEI